MPHSMEVEKRNEQIVINLTRDEVLRLQAGKAVYGDRPGVTMMDAKVDVFPMKVIDPNDSEGDRYSDNRLERAIKSSLRATLASDGDIQLFVPIAKLIDVRLTHSVLPKESIETPITNDRQDLLGVIPEGGIRLNFGGSLKFVHIPHFFL